MASPGSRNSSPSSASTARCAATPPSSSASSKRRRQPRRWGTIASPPFTRSARKAQFITWPPTWCAASIWRGSPSVSRSAAKPSPATSPSPWRSMCWRRCPTRTAGATLARTACCTWGWGRARCCCRRRVTPSCSTSDCSRRWRCRAGPTTRVRPRSRGWRPRSQTVARPIRAPTFSRWARCCISCSRGWRRSRARLRRRCDSNKRRARRRRRLAKGGCRRPSHARWRPIRPRVFRRWRRWRRGCGRS